MHDNRNTYLEAKRIWLDQVAILLEKLAEEHSYFRRFEPKDCISRITNNRMHRPDLPPYKDYFNFSVIDKTDNFSPLHIIIGTENSFLGCGYHNG